MTINDFKDHALMLFHGMTHNRIGMTELQSWGAKPTGIHAIKCAQMRALSWTHSDHRSPLVMETSVDLPLQVIG